MRFVKDLGARGVLLALVAVCCAHCGSVTAAAQRSGSTGANEPDEESVDASAVTPGAEGTSTSTPAESIPDAGGGDATVVGGGSDQCADATLIQIDGKNPRADLQANTTGFTHNIDAPGFSGDQSPDVFYKFVISKPAFIYADTFGASWDTVLFLLSDDCEPISISTTPGDAVYNDNACGTSQSRLVARLPSGSYRLGLSGRGGAQGAATVHVEKALAGSGTSAQLPSENSIQTGETAGSESNIDGLSRECLAAGAENSYWWARCPSDPARTITAATCGGGTTWESVIEAQIPKAAPSVPSAYRCNLNGCGLQGSLTTTIPAGAGLGVLSIDGQSGNDFGPYSMTVTYSP